MRFKFFRSACLIATLLLSMRRSVRCRIWSGTNSGRSWKGSAWNIKVLTINQMTNPNLRKTYLWPIPKTQSAKLSTWTPSIKRYSLPSPVGSKKSQITKDKPHQSLSNDQSIPKRYPIPFRKKTFRTWAWTGWRLSKRRRYSSSRLRADLAGSSWQSARNVAKHTRTVWKDTWANFADSRPKTSYRGSRSWPRTRAQRTTTRSTQQIV